MKTICKVSIRRLLSGNLPCLRCFPDTFCRYSLFLPALLLWLGSLNLQGQGVGIGENNFAPDPSAILELRSTERGFLVPRMNTAQRVAIIPDAGGEGLLVYDTDTRSFWFYEGGWKTIASVPLGAPNQVLGMNQAGDANEYKSLEETPNQVLINNTPGNIKLSTPQDIHFGASPEFAGLTLSGLTSARPLRTDGAGNLVSGAINLSLSSEVNNLLPIIHGGTNSGTALVNNRLMISGGGRIIESGPLANGQVIVGSTGNAPQIVNLSGDATINQTGELTLENTGVTSGSYGNPTQVGVFTVDEKGRLTFANNVDIEGTSPVGSGLGSSNIWVGSGSDQAHEVPVTGDVTISFTGETSIGTSRVNNSMLADGAVTTEKIDDNAVTQNRIATSAVGTLQLIDGNVTTDKLADNTVNNAKLAENAVGGTNIINGSVTTNKLANENVTTDKLADAAVTNQKIANNAAIELSKLAPGSDGQIIVGSSTGVPTYVNMTGDVTINNVGVTTIGTSSINNSMLEDGAITTEKIAEGTIIDADISNFAAIVGTKVVPNFGNQNIITTGTVNGRDVGQDGTYQDNLQTLTGVLAGNTDLGTFSGSTISENSDIKTALQELEILTESGLALGLTEVYDNNYSLITSDPNNVIISGTEALEITADGGLIANIAEINGGTINNTLIGGTTAAPASFTNLNADTTTLGEVTGTSLAVTGGITSSGNAGIGYTAGFTISQTGSKSDPVTINSISGKITTYDENVPIDGNFSFTVNNSTVSSTDVPFVAIANGAGFNYLISVTEVGNSYFEIGLKNISGSERADEIEINFAIIKAAHN